MHVSVKDPLLLNSSKASQRSRAAVISFVTILMLSLLKCAAAYKSGSVSILSEAIHSLLDLAVSFLTFVTVREALKPADEEHPFGHGKFETVASLFECMLLGVAGAMIIKESINRIQAPEPILSQPFAVAVCAVSAVVNLWVYARNRRVSEETDSAALKANANHFLADFVTSTGILVGLLVMSVTQWYWIDGLIGLVIGLFVLGLAIIQLRENLFELLDNRLPRREVEQIKTIIGQYKPRLIDFHDLRTRKSGTCRHLDFHMVVCGQETVEFSHELCDAIESDLQELYQQASIQIHVEPCKHIAYDCQKFCTAFQQKKG